jgi:impB/mucB/samB family C-terminal domain
LRLNSAGIFTPLEFFRASEAVLSKQVFRSVMGHHWYLKLRGYETEVPFGIRTVGRSYVLEHRTADPEEIAALLHKACVKLARRLRTNNLAARGLALRLGYEPRFKRWQGRKMHQVPARRSGQLYGRALALFGDSPPGEVLASLEITAYAVEPARAEQLCLYEDDGARQERIEAAMNAVNDRYGELTLAPAALVWSRNPMLDKVPFGSVRYFD